MQHTSTPASSSRRLLVQPRPQQARLGAMRLARRPLRCRAERGVNAAEEVGQQTSSDDLARQSLEHAFTQTFSYVAAEEKPELDEVSSMRRKLEAIGRELSVATEAEFSSLASAPSPRRPRTPPEGIKRSSSGHFVLPLDAPATPTPAPAAAAAAAPAPQPAPAAPAAPTPAPARELNNNVIPLPPHLLEQRRTITPEGSGREILLQGFNWESWKHDWFNTLNRMAPEIGDMGFTAIWLPPFTDSVSEQGYMPRDLYNLNSKYGSEEDLIRCVKALQGQGLKVLGDAVLNHRCAHFQDQSGRWNLFGGKLAWDQRAIVGDQHEYGGRGNRSSGESFGAAPNIDHSQPFVKTDLCEWLQWLRSHVGFDGWRLDFVKGFHGSHVKDYMEASNPEFVVGEYWDSLSYEWDGTPSHSQDGHRQRTVNWINAAGGLATAFDITTKGIMHAVFERCEYWRLRDAAGKPPGLLGWWPSRSVTFLENHDTGSTQGHWRFPGHALEQGYVYILTHPGTPTVFWDHVYENEHMRHVVKRLVEVRKRNGIHARSQVKILKAERDVYAAEIDGRLIMKIGPGDFAPDAAAYGIGKDAPKRGAVDCGHCWAIWEKKA